MCLLQSLPRSVVQKIVHYVTNCSRQLFSGTAIELHSQREMLMPLLWVCRSFRDVVYAQYSTEYELHIGSSTFGDWTSWPPGLRKIVSPPFRLVSALTIVVDLHSVFSGAALPLASVFPAATSLTCVLTWTPVEGPMDKAEAFVERVKCMAPMADTISVLSPATPNAGTLTASRQFGSLVSQLCQDMNHVSFSSWAPLTSLALQPEAIRDLAQLDYRIKDGDIGNVLLVARQSALTLRCLAITAQQDISALVHDDGYVAYPCLDTLDLNLQAIPGLRLVTNGVLFPNLRRLSIRHEYPFADDTLFRGNAMALEFLRLMPSRHVCDVIREFDVFTASSHPKMDCVKIDQLPENTPSHFESSFAYLQFVLDIAPRPKILDVGDIPGDGVFALRLLEPYSSIRVLALPHLRLELLDVVSIVHWLPHLSDLYTRPVALGMLGDGVLDRFPDRMCALYRPDRVALRCWHLDCWQAGNTDVLGVLGVALMCPQFNHVALAGSVHAAFMKLMEEIIESGGFKRYAPRLRLLLFARQF